MLALQPVNKVLGDTSFVFTFGRLPNETDLEQLRISTHLKYVCNKLEENTSFETQRKVNLGYLREYINNNNFPKRNDKLLNVKRLPVFRDSNGTYCAVAYIMHKNGLDLENVIHSKFNFAYLDTDFIASFPELQNWIKNCGLTVEELQCIQPTYDHMRPKLIIDPKQIEKFKKIRPKNEEKKETPKEEKKNEEENSYWNYCIIFTKV